MTAPTKTLRTPAEAEILDRYAKLRAALPGTEDVRSRRDESFALFERFGLPHRRVEEWKYSDLRARLRKSAPPASTPDAKAAKAALAAAADPFEGIDRYRLVIVDGVYQPELSRRDGFLAEGIEVVSLAAALSEKGGEAVFTAPDIAATDVAVALNAAFASDGVVISIAKGSRLSKPLQIVHVTSGGTAASVHVRNRVVLGDDVDATIIETSLGGTEGSEINLVTSYSVGKDSHLTIVRAQATTVGTTHIGSDFVSLGGNVHLKHLSLESGAGFSRNQTFLTFGGEHSRAEVYGVTMLNATRHIDQTLVVDHAVPHCQSAELFKAVIDDRATGAFQGKIIVRRDAQKTNGKMMSQALLLSEEAEMAAKPELEIFADDVVCGHGATAGQIDETQLFYLMARGVPRPTAEQLLIEAFLAGPIDALGDDAVTDVLKASVAEWLRVRNASRGADGK